MDVEIKGMSLSSSPTTDTVKKIDWFYHGCGNQRHEPFLLTHHRCSTMKEYGQYGKNKSMTPLNVTVRERPRRDYSRVKLHLR
ncbi:hypothetical protein QE152_g5031 [Popillia japonica]|uniref:Uncharacterized protein n=1 Tax=Popillia japonica TaxID=7064 RepID=A0AAW1MV79_POPJA